ncbi:putative ATP-grasp-modified RiPP [Cryptosporangium sp. NPDC051539]|uniref:putative ATP-grasp-modified RiPP n=1 Tax=Cryptosporangium sp. NPDC051539 TaxID=3363962 RepID=UPI003795EA58
MTSQHAAYATVFPISDQLPLGRAMMAALRSGEPLGSDGVKTGHDPDERPAEGAARPFGLRFATLPEHGVELPLDAIAYDDDAQIALARDGAGWTPLIDHSMGLTLRTTGQIPREDEIHDKSS